MKCFVIFISFFILYPIICSIQIYCDTIRLNFIFYAFSFAFFYSAETKLIYLADIISNISIWIKQRYINIVLHLIWIMITPCYSTILLFFFTFQMYCCQCIIFLRTINRNCQS